MIEIIHQAHDQHCDDEFMKEIRPSKNQHVKYLPKIFLLINQLKNPFIGPLIKNTFKQQLVNNGEANIYCYDKNVCHKIFGAHVAKFYGRLRLVRSVWRSSKLSVFKVDWNCNFVG